LPARSFTPVDPPLTTMVYVDALAKVLVGVKVTVLVEEL
jgi:hypothetical protein